jgi:hypothetical protein
VFDQCLTIVWQVQEGVLDGRIALANADDLTDRF